MRATSSRRGLPDLPSAAVPVARRAKFWVSGAGNGACRPVLDAAGFAVRIASVVVAPTARSMPSFGRKRSPGKV